jgi:hypothetical protein
MNRNNFFRRFAFFYKQNLEGIKDDAENVFGYFIDFVEDTFFDFIHLLLRIISVFVPIIPIITTILTEYIDDVTVKREEERLNIRFSGAGYYVKKKLRDKMARDHHSAVKEILERQKSD